MNKILKGALCTGLCGTMLAAAFTTGCNKQTNNPETRPLQLATAALDGNFNPFFYTSLNDGNMVALTQISMLTNDADGKLVCGEDWPTVVLDKNMTMYTTKDGNTTTSTGSMDGRTEYEFVIKNGIKFSNGSDLTIKDVLFNLYVYLDPAYTGSMTLYSVDIQGLNAYRMQDPEAQDGDLSNVDASFTGDALARVNNLIRWSSGQTNSYDAEDLALVKELFMEEITTDYTAIESSWSESFKENYSFQSAWEAYLFNEGIVSVQQRKNENGSYTQLKDENGKYYTTLDAGQPGAEGLTVGVVEHKHLIDEIADHVSEKLSEYKTEHNCDDATATAALQREAAIAIVYRNYTADNKIQEVLSYWATGSNVLEEFVGQARTKYYEDLKNNNNGELVVPTIKGITTYKTSTFNGKNLGGEHDVLKIVINGVDPKAEYNFSFPVAPMYYYSDAEHIAQADGVSHFGVDLGNKEFYDDVVQAPAKNGVPMGAGPYQAASRNDGETVTANTFFQNNTTVFFARNDNFESVGSGISNAKIRRIIYNVRSDDQIITALKTGEIDYGEPNAIPDNQREIENMTDRLSSVTYRTNGYGYVGINPKFVPEVQVRRALMKAMDTNSIISNYYGNSFAQPIYRLESTVSWAYPQGAKEYPAIEYTTQDDEIIDLVESVGYFPGTDGVRTNTQNGRRLEFTFTIAGDSANHPAYAMFQDAADRLNKIGFKITVSTAIDALRKLNSGALEVWAAAYTSTIDPDMYQVWHKDSRATSVNNWNYPGILNDTQGIYSFESGIIDSLSEKIELARQSTEESVRKPIYHDCYDLIMELSVALPTYQRNDLCVYNKTVIDAKSLVQNPTCYLGLIGNIWEVNYV